MKKHTFYRNFIKQAIARSETAQFGKVGKAGKAETAVTPEVIADVVTIVETAPITPAAVEPVKVEAAPADELEVYTLTTRGKRIVTKDLIGICEKVSARTSGKRDVIVFRGSEVVAIPAAILKPMARLFDQFMNIEITRDMMIFHSEDNRSHTTIKAAALEKVGKLIAVDVMAL